MSYFKNKGNKDVYCMCKVFIDSGHGGNDPGACFENIKEKDINLEVGLMLGELLTKKGFTVDYSRTTDTFVSRTERANKSNNFGSHLFISIHCNAHSNRQVQGVETFYYMNSLKGKLLAGKIQRNIIDKNIYTKNRGVKPEDFCVLRKTKAVAVLVELGFITNRMDLDIVLRNKRAFVDAVAEGIKENLE